MRRYRWMAAVATLALVSAACSGSSGSASSGTATPTASGPRPSTDAVLTIVSPTNGEAIRGTDVPLKVRLQGGTIVSVAGSTTLVPNEGHLHVYLDDQLVTMTATSSTTIPNVQPGPHLLKVEFVANDHFPYDPRVIQVVSFEVKPS